MGDNTDRGRILHPRDVAALAGVSTQTVARWADSGKIPSYKTFGRHRRFREKEVLAALEAMGHELLHEEDN